MSKRLFNFLSLFVVVVLAGAVLSACGTDSSNESSSGGSEAALVIYSGRGENLVKPIIDRFSEDTGIVTEVRYAGSPELAAQLLEEGSRTNADVFLSQDAGALGAVENAGLLGALPAELLGKADEKFRSDADQWVGVSARARVLAYNPNEVKEGDLPDSVFDLTDERWRGRVGIAPTNASFQAFVTGMRLTSGEQRTQQFLNDLKTNDPKIYANNIQTLDAVDKGEVAVGLVNHYYLYERINERGAENVTARNHFLGNGDPGALINVAGVGIIANTDRRADAERFVEFMLSPEAQRYFSEETSEYPVVAGVEPARDIPPLDTIGAPDVHLSDLESLDRTQAMLREAGLI